MPHSDTVALAIRLLTVWGTVAASMARLGLWGVGLFLLLRRRSAFPVVTCMLLLMQTFQMLLVYAASEAEPMKDLVVPPTLVQIIINLFICMLWWRYLTASLAVRLHFTR